MRDALRPPRDVCSQIENYIADRVEAQEAKIDRFLRTVTDQRIGSREVASRLGISMASFYDWKQSKPWKLPNFGRSASGPDTDYSCSLADLYDWYHVPGVVDPDAYHRREWEALGLKGQAEARGIAV